MSNEETRNFVALFGDLHAICCANHAVRRLNVRHLFHYFIPIRIRRLCPCANSANFNTGQAALAINYSSIRDVGGTHSGQPKGRRRWDTIGVDWASRLAENGIAVQKSE